MRIRFLEAAQREVDDAVTWYNQREEALGFEFLDELDRSIRRIKSFPLGSPEVEPGIRRCLLARLIYGIDEDLIIVVAVPHLHRNPRYWIDRL